MIPSPLANVTQRKGVNQTNPDAGRTVIRYSLIIRARMTSAVTGRAGLCLIKSTWATTGGALMRENAAI